MPVVSLLPAPCRASLLPENPPCLSPLPVLCVASASQCDLGIRVYRLAKDGDAAALRQLLSEAPDAPLEYKDPEVRSFPALPPPASTCARYASQRRHSSSRMQSK